MNSIIEKNHNGYLFRIFNKYHEIAYAQIGLSGLCAEIEFPSDWHERQAAWVRLGFGFFKFAFSFPWKWVVPDEYQCSGPTYGFTFFERTIHLHWGKCKGTRDDPIKIIYLPWDWDFYRHTILNIHQNYYCDARELKEPWNPPDEVKQTYDYTYTLNSGEVQHRKATVFAEEREWRWHWFKWLPYPRKIQRTLSISFDKEVGERTGSWKGGVTGHGCALLPTESLEQCLRRYERNVKHN